MVYIFIYDSLFNNHNISYNLDKLVSHLTWSKANVSCSKSLNPVLLHIKLSSDLNSDFINNTSDLMFQTSEINY